MSVLEAKGTRLLFIAAAFGLGGCSQPAQFVQCRSSVEELAEYSGRDYGSIVASLGNPEAAHDFVVTDATRLYEYQSGIYRYKREGDPLLVREASWSNGSHVLKVWFEKDESRWIGLEGLCYDDSVVDF